MNIRDLSTKYRGYIGEQNRTMINSLYVAERPHPFLSFLLLLLLLFFSVDPFFFSLLRWRNIKITLKKLEDISSIETYIKKVVVHNRTAKDGGCLFFTIYFFCHLFGVSTSLLLLRIIIKDAKKRRNLINAQARNFFFLYF